MDSLNQPLKKLQYAVTDNTNVLPSFLHITKAGSLDHVAHNEPFDGFVLRDAAPAVRAPTLMKTSTATIKMLHYTISHENWHTATPFVALASEQRAQL